MGKYNEVVQVDLDVSQFHQPHLRGDLAPGVVCLCLLAFPLSVPVLQECCRQGFQGMFWGQTLRVYAIY